MKKKNVLIALISIPVIVLLSLILENSYEVANFFRMETVNAATQNGSISSVTTNNSFSSGIRGGDNETIVIARYEVRRSSGSLSPYSDDLVISFNPQTKDTYMLRVSKSTNTIQESKKMTYNDQQIGFGNDALPKLNSYGYELNGPISTSVGTLKLIERFGNSISGTVFVPNFKREELPKEVNLNVSHLDELGREIAPKETFKVFQTQKYQVNTNNILNYKLTSITNNSSGVVDKNDISVICNYNSMYFGTSSPSLEVNKKNVSLGDTLSYKLSVKSGMIYSAGETPKIFSNFKVTVPMDANLENIKNIQLKLSDGAVVGTGKVDTTSNAIVATLSKDVKDTENLYLTYDASVKQSATIGTAIKQTAEVKSDFNANGIKTYSVRSNTVESIVERQLTVKINYLDATGKKLADSISKIGFVGATYDYTADMKKIDKYKFPPKVDEKSNPISGTFEPNKDVTINLLYDLDLATMIVKFENDSGMDMSKYNYSFSTQFGENIDLSSNNEINKRVIEIEQAGYSVTPPDNVKNLPVDDHEITVFYKVVGKLELKEWPSEVNFGTQKVSTTTKIYWPTMNKNLIVKDTRGAKSSPWQLTVTEAAPLTVDNLKLEGALSYQSSTEDLPKILSKSSIIVESYKNVGDGEINISQNWGKENGKGIKATIPVEKQKVGTYKGILLWSLVSAPGNP